VYVYDNDTDAVMFPVMVCRGVLYSVYLYEVTFHVNFCAAVIYFGMLYADHMKQLIMTETIRALFNYCTVYNNDNDTVKFSVMV